jgi:hypothetical protein
MVTVMVIVMVTVMVIVMVTVMVVVMVTNDDDLRCSRRAFRFTAPGDT